MADDVQEAPVLSAADEQPATKPEPASRLGELLVRRGAIRPEDLKAALEYQRQYRSYIGLALVRLGVLSEQALAECLHKEYRLPIVDPLAAAPTSELLSLVPDTLARKHQILPISLSGSLLTIAMADPSNLAAINECKFRTGCNVRIVIAPVVAMAKAIERAYTERAKAYTDALNRLDTSVTVVRKTESVDLAELQRATEEAPLVKLVDALMTDAVERRASDIHIEPYENDLRIRFRVDGILYDLMQPSPRFKEALASRIKIMASLDIAERRLPQDGSIKVRLQNGQEVSFRVSSLPTINGEKIVLRLMDKTGLKLDMTKLGFEPTELELFKSAIQRPHGMVLLTGPTGSGKTTTLYSLLSEINRSLRNISTAEDPAELNLRGINQVQINEDIGLTFATALRAFLRQDPDVIMVGEIRDYETAEIAVKAALTGHLLLSTLHTNDAPSSVTRLLDMGVEPFLVSSSLILVAAQRLVRVICAKCRVDEPLPGRKSLVESGFREDELDQVKLYRGAGCDECGRTGYKGRIALFEVLPLTDEVRDMIVARAHAAELRRKSIEMGMRTLRESGLDKARRGQTTLEEVLRVTGAE